MTNIDSAENYKHSADKNGNEIPGADPETVPLDYPEGYGGEYRERPAPRESRTRAASVAGSEAPGDFKGLRPKASAGVPPKSAQGAWVSPFEAHEMRHGALPREMPHSFEAEHALLGALMFDNKALDFCDGVRAEAFYDPVHGRIFSTMREMILAGKLADGLTLRERFQSDGDIREIGGAGYLLVLMENAARLTSQVRDYAALIMDLAARRDLIRTAGAMMYAATTGETPASEIIAEAEAALTEVTGMGSIEDRWESVGDLAFHGVEEGRAGRARGISTGFPSVDELTNGFAPETLWVGGGATSMGKSVLALQFAVNVAQQGYGVGVNLLEMARYDFGRRVAATLAFQRGDISAPKYLDAARGELSEAQWARMAGAAKAARQLPIFVDSRGGRKLSQIEGSFRRLIMRMKRERIKPGLLVVDHQGLIANEAHFSSQFDAASARGNGLLEIAKRLGPTVFAVAQLTNDGARKDGEEHLPTTQDIAYGAALTQAAETVVLIHRPSYYAERKPEAAKTDDDRRKARSFESTIVVDKARGGRRGQVTVHAHVGNAHIFEPETPTRAKVAFDPRRFGDPSRFRDAPGDEDKGHPGLTGGDSISSRALSGFYPPTTTQAAETAGQGADE